NFKAVEAGQPVETFTYGESILGLELISAQPSNGQVTVAGEGAAGSNGSDAWGWLLKDASGVTSPSGGGDPQRLISDGSLRSSDGSQTAAETIAAAAAAQALSGWILVPGTPSAIPGASIEIDSAPVDALNGTCLV